MVTVSIIVCTRNRAAILGECLESLAALDGAPFEVLVVDNGSTDDTASVVERFTGRVPDLRYVVDPQQGLSHARNTAIDEAKGDVLSFFDDDVLVDPGWLEALRGAFNRWPDAAGMAGRIRLRWLQPRPSWFVPELETWLSGFDKGDDPRLLEGREVPFGANMSVRRDVAQEVGGFAVDLGYSGRSLLGNEEVDFFRRVRSRGEAVGYEPSAEVYHRVSDERLTRRWLVRRIYSQGRADARLASHGDLGRRGLRREARRALNHALWRGWGADVQAIRSASNRGGQVTVAATGRARRFGYGRECLWLALRRNDGEAASS